MQTYILIMIAISSMTGQVEAIHSTEFSGKATCEAAAKQLAKDGVLKTTCVPK
jgi:hypothetical protein